MNRTLYTALFYLGLPLVAIRLWLRSRKAPAYAKRIGERFSLGLPTMKPGGIWVHWVAWDIPPQTREIPENGIPAGAKQGRNDWKRNDYGGPCPPSGTHRYFFKIYALDTTLTLAPSETKADLERAMQGHVLAAGQLMGTYKRR